MARARGGTERDGEEGVLPFWRRRKGLVRRTPCSGGSYPVERLQRVAAAGVGSAVDLWGGARHGLGFSPGIRAVLSSWAVRLGRCWAAHSVPLRPCPCKNQASMAQLVCCSFIHSDAGQYRPFAWVKRPKCGIHSCCWWFNSS